MCCLGNEQSRNYSVITLSGTAWFPLALGRWRANQGPRSQRCHISAACAQNQPATSLGLQWISTALLAAFLQDAGGKFTPIRAPWVSSLLLVLRALFLSVKQSGWAGWGSEGSQQFKGTGLLSKAAKYLWVGNCSSVYSSLKLLSTSPAQTREQHLPGVLVCLCSSAEIIQKHLEYQ